MSDKELNPQMAGTSECPICGKASPHWHHPETRNAAQIIASLITGAGRGSAFNNRWLATAQGRSACEVAEEILRLGARAAQ